MPRRRSTGPGAGERADARRVQDVPASWPTRPTTTTARYRTSEEVEAWRKKDPLRRMQQLPASSSALLSAEADEDRIEAEVKAEVADVVPRQMRAEAPSRLRRARRGLRPTGLRPTAPAPSGACSTRRRPPPVAPPRPSQRLSGLTTERNMVDTVRQTQHDLMAADERVVVLGEDVGHARRRVPRHRRAGRATFGAGRVLDTPLAESSIIGIGDRAGAGRAAADRRDPVRRLHPLGLRPAGERGGPASTTGPTATSTCRWWCARRGAVACTARPYHSQSIEAIVRAHPRAQGGGPVHAGRRGRAAPRRRSTTPTRCSSSSTRRPTG